jgi:hypothetical protein
MFAVCHGEASSGATHVPTAIQGNILDLAVAKDTSCAILEPHSDVLCWGTGLQPPTVTCSSGSTASEIHVWENTISNTINGAILCSNQDLIQWNSNNDTITTIQSVSHVSSAPTNLCYTVNGTGTCLDFTVPGGLAGFASKTFAGDASTCVLLNIGTSSISCYGSLSSLDTSIPSGSSFFVDARLSGNIGCFQWNNGWLCLPVANDTGAESLVQLWPFVTSAKSNSPVGLGPLDVWYNFSSSKGILCAVRDQSKETWCQGTGFTSAGDMNDAVFQINAENTQDAANVYISSTHICTTINQQSYSWVWIVAFAFIAFLLILIYLSYKHNSKVPKVESYRIMY